MFVVALSPRPRSVTDVAAASEQLWEQLDQVCTLAPFTALSGQLLLGVPADADAAVDAILRTARLNFCNIGLGVGSLYEPVPAEADLVDGRALRRAQGALDAAEHRGERVPICVSTANTELDGELEGLLRLIGQSIRTRTDSEWAVVDLLTPGVRGQQKAVAQILGITPQAVSAAIVRSGYNDELGARSGIARLLDLADQL
ncbi:hypothetical protein AUR04nite_29250 [Glutamicibacter uratoxydans]|uniref:Uncharacterized protein n=1 Tax=Glutamicibacter uratoxydans TaxID=43667 RepID=A0A4Y4DRX8_GLUUR|nr:hypothetical protein [Glutamicibacter uratoxydans]GED07393.1 hypothetical protein AUR04nite_29250 [Glutamicibacter uratoxydans]